ncbi:MAG: hypothetical protein ACM3UU_00325 [Ignavibacteriales bacterium]
MESKIEKDYLVELKRVLLVTQREKGRIPENNRFKDILNGEFSERILIRHLAKAFRVAERYGADITDRLNVGVVALFEYCFDKIGLEVLNSIESQPELTENEEEKGYEAILSAAGKLIQALEKELDVIEKRQEKIGNLTSAEARRKIKAGTSEMRDERDLISYEIAEVEGLLRIFVAALGLLQACEMQPDIVAGLGELIGLVLSAEERSTDHNIMN